MDKQMLALELIVCVVAGYLSSFLVAGEHAFLFGLVLFVLIEIVRLRIQSSQTHGAVMLTDSFVRSLTADDAPSELRYLYGLRAGSRLSADVVRVPKSETLRFWRDCVARASSRWFVTTYALPDETWSLGWAAATSLNVQRERIDAGCQIERIFIVDSEQERDSLLNTMKQQAELKVKVRWILKSKLLEKAAVAEAYRELGTLDLALVDDRWVYRTELDKQRSILGASVTDNQGVAERARFFFTEAYGKSEPYVPAGSPSLQKQE